MQGHQQMTQSASRGYQMACNQMTRLFMLEFTFTLTICNVILGYM